MSVGLFIREMELERLAKKWRKRPCVLDVS